MHFPLQVGADDPDRSVPPELNEKLLQRQRAFISTLLKKPHYGELVRWLTWTNRTLYNDVDEQIAERNLWTALSTLRKVHTVDIVSQIWDREIDPPPPRLFPAAQTLRLGGVFSFALLRSILHGADPAQLQSLDLDNLHDLGQLCDGEDLPPGTDLSMETETFEANGTSRLRHTGPMRNHLRSLLGRCTSLRYLSLRSVGQDDAFDHYWSATKDEERYAEAAAFLASVKSTLRTFVFEQGLQPEEGIYNSCGPRQRTGFGMSKAVRPMDTRFVEYILPVLLEEPWPNLREVIIRGVGGRTRIEVRPESMEMDQKLYNEIYGKDGQPIVERPDFGMKRHDDFELNPSKALSGAGPVTTFTIATPEREG
ncbi:hypothetical protein MMC13_005099 [Lambiella insularis]|nr:hypothetical protein [Lambiella insularis]